MAKLEIRIVTAERVVYEDEVDMVVAPGIQGELTVLPNHAPLMTSLQEGALLVRKDDEEVDMVVSGGFLEVQRNKVTILAETAERAEEIDEARAVEARRRAEERLAQRDADMDVARVEAALRRSMMRLRVLDRRRRRGGGRQAPPPA